MTYSITAEKRITGERRNLSVPGVIYGRGINTQTVFVSRSDFLRVLKGAGHSNLVDVAMEQQAPVKTLIKEVQFHPLSGEPIHVDLYQVRMDQEMTASIPLVFVGESRAMKIDAGTLVKSLDELEIRCLPAYLPSSIEVNLSPLATFEDAITVASLKLPEGVVAETPGDVIVATVEAPLTEEQLKKMEESAVGDVTSVKSETEEKRAEKEAAAAAEKTKETGK